MSRREHKSKPRRLTVTIPERVGPHVKLVFAEMQRRRFTYDEIEARSGVLRPTLKAWRHKNAPGLSNIEAVLGALDWDLIPVPRDRVLDADILTELQPIADRLGLSLGDAIQFATEIAVGRHSKNPLPA
ncbi:hypothetical protein [Microvirga thermotolerans]|uniref:Uncharacterized protein n=1 Tax=Microvirga thermotolerans TaxID=2651334 RepID=A0A5P9JYS8_9HYPH|nr:hypothetical protein [Microvirga thermotolerans]QFU16570.1 hypothetical protein GDR74_10205 [Microvirga thermotolerans]